tara:strand:- start:4124 stop:4552 length:429 start_codon:yes stop_codon:yes gene_type:complete
MKKYITLATILVILDQLTKWFFQEKTIELSSWLSFTYVKNTGAAFGSLQGYNSILIIITIIILGICFYYFKNYKLPLALIIAGGIGNLIDRIFFGFVRDFISVSVWPVFNIADASNTIGVIFLAYVFYKEEKLYKAKNPKES